ncbi:MAG TPA: porphobilinogen synthase [Actinomycetes bacterium]|jgi:porphobilinogen synthase|nr:porphobilinogen synthase [Actinomycetes bacterium]
MQPAPFPVGRPRRLRSSRVLRELVREHELSRRDLVAPLFVKEGIAEAAPIASMPGHAQHTLESLRKEAAELAGLGIPALLLFGIPAGKDAEGSQAWAPEGIIQRALRALRADLGDDVALIADLCLCEYTDHGHCGALAPANPGALGSGPVVANDPTLELYRRIAVAQAEAGATVVAPSGMMDGQVAAIRGALDEAGFADTPILAYAAKYASGLYGPFREAAEGAPRFGDRTGYQMDPANGDEALREVALDVAEGADMVMVKPAMTYLDVLWRVKQAFGLPTAAYHVSGEFAMVKAAAERGWVDGERVMLEVLTSIRRAGADLVVTYFARDAAPLL